MSNYNLTYNWSDSTVVTFAGSEWKTKDWETSNGTSGQFRWTYEPTSNVTFTFPVPAIAFYFYGIPRGDTNGDFAVCVDCAPPASTPETVDSIRDGLQLSPPTVFYSRRFSEPGIHKIVIWPLNGEITVDHFEIEAGNSSNMPTSTTSTHSATGMPGSRTLNKGVSIGALVGGVIGSVLTVALVGLVWFWCWKRRDVVKYMNENGGNAATKMHIPPSVPHGNHFLGAEPKLTEPGGSISTAVYKGLPEPSGV